jgi:hypothetical protein
MPAPHRDSLRPLTPIGLPPCPLCGGRMWLTRIEPDRPGYEQRIFSCTQCAHEDCKVTAIGE